MAYEKNMKSRGAVAALGLELEVLSVVSVEQRKSRPLPLNTVEMLKLASKTLGMSAHTALQTAERLYLLGMISKYFLM